MFGSGFNNLYRTHCFGAKIVLWPDPFIDCKWHEKLRMVLDISTRHTNSNSLYRTLVEVNSSGAG